ncbi:hypothetical protein IFR05_007855 [Cadophora sp. M221]|nr:hypothetical protein IFR05_007855 [Cadophora sp. M221]
MKTHTKPYVCDHCSADFALRNDLDRHGAQHGRVNTKFYCKWPDCQIKAFSRRDNLLRHMRKVHETINTTDKKDMQSEVQMVYKKSLKEQKISTRSLSLMKAVRTGNISIVMLLLLNGADITQRNDTGQTSLHLAAMNGNLEMMRVLLNNGIDIEAKDKDNKTAFYHAVMSGDEAIVQTLIQHGAGACITERNRNGSTPLHDFSSSGHEHAVRLLLDLLVKRNANLDILDNDKKTALYWAASCGHSAVVAMLLAAGASTVGRPTLSNTSNELRWNYRTALEAAVKGRYEDVVAVLLAAGADPNFSPDFHRMTALQHAVAWRHQALMERLTAAGADVNLLSFGCNTALTMAAGDGYKAAVAHLIAAGGNVNWVETRYSCSRTALQAAVSGHHEAIVEELVAAGADVNLGSGRCPVTPLFLAVQKGDGAMVEKLISAGANLGRTLGSLWFTALQLARKGGHGAIVEKLVAAGADDC